MGQLVQILRIQEIDIKDFPKRVACKIFLSGCNFRCPFCYVPQFVLGEKIYFQEKIPKEDFFSFLQKKKNELQGVVICGGEPLVNEDLEEFCQGIKNLGFFIKINTNGSNPSLLKKLIEKNFLDYVSLDIKAPREKYGEAIGYFNPFLTEKVVSAIEESLEILKKSKIEFECKTTFVPGILGREDIFKIARWISKFCQKYVLRNFRPQNTLDKEFEKFLSYSIELLYEIKEKISPFFKEVEIEQC